MDNNEEDKKELGTNIDRPETNYFKMFQRAPAPIAISVVLFILGAILNLIGQSWVNFCLCVWGINWVLKGFGAIRWFVIISGVLSLISIILNTPKELSSSFLLNITMCVVHVILLYSTPARKWFREKGAAYAAWRCANKDKEE